jgi:DNA invertase Pin-like site-specific DNA recombinase
MPSNSTPATAYSYIRFSTPEHSKGDSLRRQQQLARSWCERNQVELDQSTKLEVESKSAFTGEHRSNPDRHALALFLKLVESGKVAKGSYLVVESLDRLTREHIQPALMLLLNLLQSGIRIVQLVPVEMVYDSKSDTLQLMIMLVELSRGHSESAVKSERVRTAWQEKKLAAQKNELQPTRKTRSKVNGKKVMTSNLPAWLQLDPHQDKPLLDAKKAIAVRKIYHLAAAGYGRMLIAKQLTKEKVKPIGREKHWSASYIGLILRDRRAVGEYQPRDKKGKADGPLLKDYFPPAVTEDEWLAATEAISQRSTFKGRTSNSHVNPFSGLLRSALDGGTYVTATTSKHDGRGGDRVLINSSSYNDNGKAPCRTFPLAVFEAAILSELREIHPHDILNGHSNGPDATVLLGAALAQVEAKIAAISTELRHTTGEVKSVIAVLTSLEAERNEVAARLMAARQKALHPVSESWGESNSLIEALSSAPDKQEARLRLRSVLRRIIEAVYVIVVPDGLYRIAQVQVFFRDSEASRSFWIYYRPKLSNGKQSKAGRYYCTSIRREELEYAYDVETGTSSSGFGGDDLRDPEIAAYVGRSLGNNDKKLLEHLLKEGQPLPAKE